MKKRIAAVALLSIAIVLSSWVLSTYRIPGNLILTSPEAKNGTEHLTSCFSPSDRKIRPVNTPDGSIKVLVWNIYKENRKNALSLLSDWSRQRQLILLQEATVDDAFWMNFQTKSPWHFYHVDAWEYHREKNGVLTGAVTNSSRVCGFRDVEPWLRLPKSSLLTYYPLSNGELLAVANIHAINFTLGLGAYQKQINRMVTQLEQHKGPVIFAGDFNSWNRERIAFLNKAMQKLKLKEVRYQNDKRRKRFVTGMPLDHVFYRGLVEISADVVQTDASDHNPVFATFKIAEPQ
ncbi:endonuclease/exonuclease/phosphatase family protein [Vibrio salinus]|uniref:endonuclease/exonuclease/phosphatase family protein n=1 Tax=Vibrio salinus TaxID=2899784 RepID=UPI001E4BFDA5|nr:endonuclease/exonuclease/phosphatase family protein [Vibrio salinus]MCE0494401.1 endonuclease/exonuclease/phosphatase family protein [Vibrio salinus]